MNTTANDTSSQRAPVSTAKCVNSGRRATKAPIASNSTPSTRVNSHRVAVTPNAIRPAAGQLLRSASSGSMRVARRAGTQLAAAATAVRIPQTAANVTGS